MLSYTVSKRKLLLVCSDQIAIWMGLFGSAVLRLGIREGSVYSQAYLYSFLLLSILYAATFYVADLYDPSKNIRSNRTILVVALASFAPLLLSTIFFYAHSPLRLGRSILILVGCFVFAGTVVSRWMLLKVGKTGRMKTRVLIMGTGQAGKVLLEDISRNPWNGVETIGVLNNPTSVAETAVDERVILGNGTEVEELTARFSADGIVISSAYEKLSNEVKRTLVKCRLNGIRVIDRFSFYSEFFRRIPCDYLTPEWMLYRTERLTSSLYARIRRLIDIVVAALGLAASSPLMLLVAAAVKLDSPGPVIYRQKRVGKDGREFTLLKFRSMYEDAEKDGRPVFSARNDRRITRVGKIIRKTRLDELPQLTNVLKGDMSIIGPRPERAAFVKEYMKCVSEGPGTEDSHENIPNYSIRLLVKPGITGWAQVNCGYADSMAASREKLEYDLYYIVNQSPLLDLLILLKTVKVVLFGKGV